MSPCATPPFYKGVPTAHPLYVVAFLFYHILQSLHSFNLRQISGRHSDGNYHGISPDNATLKALATRLGLDYNYLLALNNSIDDEPEIRVIQRAAKKMTDEEKDRMLQILKLSFKDLFEEDEDVE